MTHQSFYLIPSIILFVFILLAYFNMEKIIHAMNIVIRIPILIVAVIFASPFIIIHMLTGIGEPFPWRKILGLDD